LKSDGTVVAAGLNCYEQCNVKEWRGIVDIYSSSSTTIGIKSDGTVVAAGENSYGTCNSDWTDIIMVAASYTDTVGLKVDGTVAAVGKNGNCDMLNTDNTIAVSVDTDQIYCFQTDGGLLGIGNDNFNYTAEEFMRSVQWIRRGMCMYCGGQISGLMAKKCKSCKKENYSVL